MARKPLKPLIRGGGFYPSKKWTPLVYNGGYTTADGGEEPSDPLNTFTGKIVQFLASAVKPIVSLTATLSPIQDLHGHDSPWPAGVGVNKFDESVFTNYGGTLQASGVWRFDSLVNILGKVLWTAPESIGQITVTMWRKQSGVGSQGLRLVINYTDGTSVKVGNQNATSGTDVYSVTTDASKTVRDITSDYGSNQNSTDVNVVVSIGSTAPSSYSPYANLCPISGHEGVTVYRTGDNLFDQDTYFQSKGFTHEEDGSWYTNNLSSFNNVTIWENTKGATGSFGITYQYKYLNGSGSSGLRIYFVYEDGYVQRNYPTPTTEYQKLEYTTDSNRILSKICWDYGSSSNFTWIKDFCIKLGTDTTYEPYTDNTYPITFPDAAGTVYGGTLVLRMDGSGEWSGELTVDRVRKTVVGDLIADYRSFAGAVGFNISSPQFADANFNKPIMCNKLETIGPSQSQYYGACKWSGISFYFWFQNGAFTDYADAVAKTNAEQLQCCYYLAQPIVYTLTAEQVGAVITTLKGQNTMWVDDSDDISVTAYGTEVE